LLPTIFFIIAAYTLYALVVVWCRWQRSRFSGRRGQGRPRWLTLAGGAVFLGIFLSILSWLAPAGPDQKMRLAGILGVAEEGDLRWARQADLRAATLHLDQKSPDGQPAYAMLHPESPPSLQPPVRSKVGSHLRLPKANGVGVRESQKTKLEAKAPKKDKAIGKAKAKKKKVSSPTTMDTKGPGTKGG